MHTVRVIVITALVGVGCRGKNQNTESDPSADTATPLDADGDGYTSEVDCDDDDAGVNPAAVEVCDGVDQDCDDVADEALTTTYYSDIDGDGAGDPEGGVDACVAPSGFATVAGDCDDGNASVSPAAVESCDGIDQDCDGVADEGLPTFTYYADADGDGMGDAAVTRIACAAPLGFVATRGDCDDTDPLVGSGTELCDGIPNGCDPTGWTQALENGKASWFPTAGAPTDVTALLTGADLAPLPWAAPTDGELALCAGTFHALVSTGGHDVVVSGGDRATTTLSGGHVGRPLTIAGGAVTVEDLTLSDGVSAAPGGNVSCAGAALTVRRARVERGRSTAQGGGLHLACAAVLTDVVVSDNAALEGGGVWYSGSQTWSGVSITDNSGSGGGGGAWGSSAQLSCTGGDFTGNDGGSSGGGGLRVVGGGVSLSGTTLIDNVANRGGGLYADGAAAVATGLGFRANTSADSGAHVELIGGTLSGTDLEFRDGSAGGGGPIAVRANASATLRNGEVRDNVGALTGGLWVDDGTVTFLNVGFRSNAPNDARAIGQGYSIGTGASGVCSSVTGCDY